MPAIVQQRNVEGTLITEVVYTEPAVRALEGIARLLPEHSFLQLPKCDICGADAHWKAESWMRSYEITICSDHMKQREDQYKSFTRITR